MDKKQSLDNTLVSEISQRKALENIQCNFVYILFSIFLLMIKKNCFPQTSFGLFKFQNQEILWSEPER